MSLNYYKTILEGQLMRARIFANIAQRAEQAETKRQAIELADIYIKSAEDILDQYSDQFAFIVERVK